MQLIISLTYATYSAITLLDFTTVLIFDTKYTLCTFLNPPITSSLPRSKYST